MVKTMETVANNESLRWWGSCSIYKAEREEITDFPSFQNRNLQTPLQKILREDLAIVQQLQHNLHLQLGSQH
ncbi:hypothetical protein CR513_22473, partial [Mucuna pruriens]